MRPIVVLVLSVASVVLGSAACSTDDGSEAAGETDPSPSATESGGAGGVREPELRDELVAMMERDQASRTGEPIEGADADETDLDRTTRLREIVEEHGWPTFDLVGKEGATAAWLIAQHSDFDVAFQQQALELMREALAAGQADPTEVAYLEDRVAVNTGQPQTYGTQIRCRNGRARPATPIVDRDMVDERRAELGLEPLEEYFASFEEACAAEA